MADFFSTNIIGVFFFYGLAFFMMGLAVLLEIGHSTELDFARALRPLAGFGLVHGGHEWFEMGLIIHSRMEGHLEPDWVFYLRLALLASSFLMLIAFGVRLIIGSEKQPTYWTILTIVGLLWGLGLMIILGQPPIARDQLIAGDVYTRYSLAIPGSALTFWGLILQGRFLAKAGMKKYGLDVTIAAVAFALYGGIGQLFASPSILYPSTVLNSQTFLNWVGFPIQGFRALMAIVAAIFIIRSLRAFEDENSRRIQKLNDAQKAEQERLQALRSELLHRTVTAQEQERQRIAREMHDETGQTLTALGLGLNAIIQSIPSHPQRAVQQARQLQSLVANGLNDLQRLVSGLHPPQLDELGLMPALRWYIQDVKKYFDLEVNLSGSINEKDIDPETRMTLFRIAQEAITNAVRHAAASQVQVEVKDTNGELSMRVEDNGIGFNVERVMVGREATFLGLLGMKERAALIGGECQIESRPGRGTIVQVVISHAKK